MNAREIAAKYAKNDEEKQLISRIAELCNKAFNKDTVCFSNFLTPHEQTLIGKIKEFRSIADIDFNGGYADAERRMAVIKGIGCSIDIKLPIEKLSINYSGPKLTHRDILGAILGLGIKREMVGDILCGIEPQIIIVHKQIADFIILNAKKAGRANISVEVAESDLDSVQPQKKIINTTVSSLRLDAVIAEGFSIPRSKAVDAVKLGRVCLNWQEVTSPSKEVKEGDKISLKGMGKIQLSQIGGKSRKDRTFITIEKYI